MKYKKGMVVFAAAILALGVQASVTIDFDPSGEFAENFNNSATYPELLTGGLDGSVAIEVVSSTAIATLHTNGPLGEIFTIADAGDTLTVGQYINMGSLGTAVDKEVLRLGLAPSPTANFYNGTWLDLVATNAATGEFALAARWPGTRSEPFTLSAGQWYYFEASMTYDAVKGMWQQMSIHNASSDGTIGTQLGYIATEGGHGVSWAPGNPLWAGFTGMGALNDGATLALDNFYISTTGETQAGASLVPSATVSGGSVELAWAPVANADHYTIYRTLDPDGEYTAIASNLTATSYLDSSMTVNTRNYYYMEALESGVSNDTVLATSAHLVALVEDPSDVTPPAVPVNLAADGNVGDITLSWDANTDIDLADAPYTLYRSATSASGYSMIASNLDVTAYVDKDVTAGETLYYVLTATDYIGNESGFSDEASAAADIPVADGTLDMIGNTTGDPGGDFADYSGLASGNAIANWSDSVLNDGLVTLSVGGPENTDSKATFNTIPYLGPGTEIVFAKNVGHTNVTQAIAGNIFVSIRLDSTGFNSDEFTFDSIALSLWRNGSASATYYQFAYDSDGDGYDTGDLLGSPVFNNLSGSANAFEVSSALPEVSSTQQEVRLYYWGGGYAGNTHLFEAKTTYSSDAVQVDFYAAWASSFGGTNLIGSATADYDNDGVSNMGEYALNGNPTNSADRGQTALSNDATTLTYVHAKVVDNTSLIYRLLDTTDLVFGAPNTNAYTSQVTGPEVDNYQMVTNTYDMTSDELFIELEVEQQ